MKLLAGFSAANLLSEIEISAISPFHQRRGCSIEDVSVIVTSASPENGRDITSLWLKPYDAAAFLKTLPSFNFHPEVGLPPQRNRRQRRPPPRPLDADQDDDPFSSLSLPPSPFLLTPPSSPRTPLSPLPPPLPRPPPLISIRLAGAYSSISSSSLSSLLSHDPLSSPERSQALSFAEPDHDGEVLGLPS